jgi:hypothetical protein
VQAGHDREHGSASPVAARLFFKAERSLSRRPLM